jgi:hypothetical protein
MGGGKIIEFQGQESYRKKGQLSTRMLESAWSIISICWVCSLTSSRDCWLLD